MADPLTVSAALIPAWEKIQPFTTSCLEKYLAAAGVDGVKVDAQAVIGALGYGNGPNGGGPALAEKHPRGRRKSVRNFPDQRVNQAMRTPFHGELVQL